MLESADTVEVKQDGILDRLAVVFDCGRLGRPDWLRPRTGLLSDRAHRHRLLLRFVRRDGSVSADAHTGNRGCQRILAGGHPGLQKKSVACSDRSRRAWS